MPFAVHLFFDPTTEAAIKAIWKELADTGIAPYMHESANRPHITLAIYQDLDLARSKNQLESLAATSCPLSLAFQCLGIFPTPAATVFLGPTVTLPLLEFHARVYQSLGAHLACDYYLPERWIPHCTLALELEPKLISSVLDIGWRLALPLNGQILEIGLIEFRPVKHLFGFRLGPA